MACRKRSTSKVIRRWVGRVALIDAEAGTVSAVGGAVPAAPPFTIQRSQIPAAVIVMDPARLLQSRA